MLYFIRKDLFNISQGSAATRFRCSGK